MPAFGLPSGAACIVITATVGTALTLLFYGIRLFIRLRINRPFGADDLHCTIATLFAILCTSLTISQTRFGLGQHIVTLTAEELNTQHLLAWLATLAFNMALAFSMLSMCFLIVRVTKMTSQATPAYVAAGLTTLWAVVALFFIAFQCKLPYPWQTRPRRRCLDLYMIWLCLTITRSILEFINVIIAVTLV